MLIVMVKIIIILNFFLEVLLFTHPTYSNFGTKNQVKKKQMAHVLQLSWNRTITFSLFGMVRISCIEYNFLWAKAESERHLNTLVNLILT